MGATAIEMDRDGRTLRANGKYYQLLRKDPGELLVEADSKLGLAYARWAADVHRPGLLGSAARALASTVVTPDARVIHRSNYVSYGQPTMRGEDVAQAIARRGEELADRGLLSAVGSGVKTLGKVAVAGASALLGAAALAGGGFFAGTGAAVCAIAGVVGKNLINDIGAEHVREPRLVSWKSIGSFAADTSAPSTLADRADLFALVKTPPGMPGPAPSGPGGTPPGPEAPQSSPDGLPPFGPPAGTKVWMGGPANAAAFGMPAGPGSRAVPDPGHRTGERPRGTGLVGGRDLPDPDALAMEEIAASRAPAPQPKLSETESALRGLLKERPDIRKALGIKPDAEFAADYSVEKLVNRCVERVGDAGLGETVRREVAQRIEDAKYLEAPALRV